MGFDLLNSLLIWAKSLFYDNSNSGLIAKNVQDAIDEIAATGSGQPYDTLTDPALNSIDTTMIDTKGGVAITLTGAGNSQTLPDPTNTSINKSFTVINNSTSTNSIDIVVGDTTVILDVGKRVLCTWATTKWVPSDSEAIMYDNGTNVTPEKNRGFDSKTGVFTSTITDTTIEAGDATKNIVFKLKEALGVTYHYFKDSAGTVLGHCDSLGNWLLGKLGVAGVIEVRDSSDITKVKANAEGDSFFNGGNVAFGGTTSDATIHNHGSLNESQTIVNTATYELLTTDRDLSVTYTATGACAITIPAVQDIQGRIIDIADDGSNALTNNITIYDDAGTPNLLFTISANDVNLTLKYNGTAWRIK